MKLYKMQIGDTITDYEIYPNYDFLLDNLDSLKYKSYYLVYDPNILSDIIDKTVACFEKNAKLTLIPFAVTEKNKDLSNLGKLLEDLVNAGITRNACILALGGGTLGNMAGLAAGLLYRGIDFIHIPTTVLACSDSVLSLKQGINLMKSKNIIGTYYHPVKIMISPELYSSLPCREITAGYAEYVKNLIIVIPDRIDGFEHFDFAEAVQYDGLCSLVEESIRAKTKLLINDEHEREDGILLEYGHTVGHSLEMMFPNLLRHGEGVAFGMMVAGIISCKMGYFSKSDTDIQKDLLGKIGIIDSLKEFFKNRNIDNKVLSEYLLSDNKRGYIECNGGEIAMVIMKKFGQPLLSNGLPIINVPLESVIESVQSVWKEIVEQA